MFKVSVPGSLMLFGEHAVLHGKMAIVAAIDSRLKFTLILNKTNNIIIKSGLGNIKFDIQELASIKNSQDKWQYVIACIKYFNAKYKIKSGFNLLINDDNLKNSIGFGSSAAVVVGVLAVLNAGFSQIKSNEILFKQALEVVHQVQYGFGSGADIAASIYGGIISLKNFMVQHIIKTSINLTAVYCGYKIKTVDVVKIINNKIMENNSLYNYIFSSINNCNKLANRAIKQQNLYLLGKLMDISHGLMTGMGIVDSTLDQIACNLRAQSTIYGAKVSGAGLGDCVIGLGTVSKKLFKKNQFNIKTTVNGLEWLK